jgi:arginine deiminase
MSDFGAHSEVGKLRKVMVHRPDLSLQRLIVVLAIGAFIS